MFPTRGLGNHESFPNEDERMAMSWAIHQASGIRAWEQANRDSSLARRPIIFEIGTYWGLSLIDFRSMVQGAMLHSLDIGPAEISDSH